MSSEKSVRWSASLLMEDRLLRTDVAGRVENYSLTEAVGILLADGSKTPIRVRASAIRRDALNVSHKARSLAPGERVCFSIYETAEGQEARQVRPETGLRIRGHPDVQLKNRAPPVSPSPPASAAPAACATAFFRTPTSSPAPSFASTATWSDDDEDDGPDCGGAVRIRSRPPRALPGISDADDDQDDGTLIRPKSSILRRRRRIPSHQLSSSPALSPVQAPVQPSQPSQQTHALRQVPYFSIHSVLSVGKSPWGAKPPKSPLFIRVPL